MSARRFAKIVTRTNDRLNKSGQEIRMQKRDGVKGFEYWSEDFDRPYQLKFHKALLPQPEPIPAAIIETTAKKYSEAADYNRTEANRKKYFLDLFKPFRGAELEREIMQWNLDHPEDTPLTYKSFMRWKKAEQDGGFEQLIGGYGKSLNRSDVTDEHLDFFESLYLHENKLKQEECWELTRAKFATRENVDRFPSCDAFMRRLTRVKSPSQIYRARYGQKKWDDKYGQYIERDYSDMVAGETWVSDHAQIDVLCTLNGKSVCGWTTSMIDMRTDKALSVVYHADPPNSDHIFEAFFLAADKYGLPKTLYIDNGKDYRCKDFAGGRPKTHKLKVDEQKAGGMLGSIGVTPRFSLPYNAKAKVIERWHLKIKEGLSRHCEGYRGGNTQERPERLAEDIKQGRLLDFNYFKGLFVDYVFNVLNKTPNDGKRCQGRSPDDLWNMHNPVLRKVSRDALMLFCMRTTKALTVGRNGVRISSEDLTYFAEWMIPLKGQKVHLRRAPDNWGEAWVTSEGGDELIGQARIRSACSALAETDVQRQEVKDAIANMKRERKAVKASIAPKHIISVEERLELKKRANDLNNPNPIQEPQQKVVQALTNTKMQAMANKAKKINQEGCADQTQMNHYGEVVKLHEQIEAAYIKIMRSECDLIDALETATTVLMPKFANVSGVDYDVFRERNGLKHRNDLKRDDKPSVLTRLREALGGSYDGTSTKATEKVINLDR
jgi:transposase InsO family protein